MKYPLLALIFAALMFLLPSVANADCAGFFGQQVRFAPQQQLFQQQFQQVQFLQQPIIRNHQVQFLRQPQFQFQAFNQHGFQFNVQNRFRAQNFVIRPQRVGVSRLLFGR